MPDSSNTEKSRSLRKTDLFPGSVCCLGLVAPAGPVSAGAYRNAVAFLQKLGLSVVCGESVLKGDDLSFLSAPAADRAADLNAVIRNPDVDGIYCLRGGYGSVHLPEYIDWTTLKKRRLPVIGYSDITALHMVMTARNAGVPVSAAMALTLEKESAGASFRRNFRRALQLAFHPGRGNFRRMARLIPYQGNGIPESPLICGNLTVTASLCGTGCLPSFSGRLILLEDIGEPVRKLDRALMQLKRSGVFADCAGVILGNFKQCGSAAERDRLFRRFSSELTVPVFGGLHYGHCSRSLSFVCGETALVRDGSLFLRDPFSGRKS